jgi:hypothetical protein
MKSFKNYLSEGLKQAIRSKKPGAYRKELLRQSVRGADPRNDPPYDGKNRGSLGDNMIRLAIEAENEGMGLGLYNSGDYNKTVDALSSLAGKANTQKLNALARNKRNAKKKVHEETSSEVEGDYEGQMARGELEYTIQNAQEILDQLKDGDELEAWVQSKITKAADYISTVKDYMAGRGK